MKIDTSNLPTHIARAVSRLKAIGSDQSANSFLYSSYLAESAIKTLGIILCRCLNRTNLDTSYRFAYSFIRSDGLGSWEHAIRGKA